MKKHKFRSRCKSIRDSAITRGNASVLSLGKLCEDHGYSYEWVSGQRPRSTKEGKTLCKTDNFVPLVFPGLPTSSGSDSSSTSTSHNSSSTSPTKSEVTDQPQETGADQPQKTSQRGMTVEIRTTVCEIFLSGWRSSLII